MSEKITVHAQGISRDLIEANGDYALFFLGLMDQEEMLGLFNRLQGFTISRAPGENTCLPCLLTLGPAGHFSFAMSEVGLFNFETSAYLTPRDAVALAFGYKNPDLYTTQPESEADTEK
ncbi:MAG TPA: hypothetical protein VMW42_03470 [Desulfatiglandales bacterium]|nr:hypothetical protein [Desulfatiglandales bacterium]